MDLKNKINILINQALDSEVKNLKEYLELKLEKDLTDEDLTQNKTELMLYNVSKILFVDSKFLSEEELAHKIYHNENQNLSVEKVNNIVYAWHKEHKRLNSLRQTYDFVANLTS